MNTSSQFFCEKKKTAAKIKAVWHPTAFIEGIQKLASWHEFCKMLCPGTFISEYLVLCIFYPISNQSYWV